MAIKEKLTRLSAACIDYCRRYPKSALVSAYILYALGGGAYDYFGNVSKLPVYRHDMIYVSTLRDDMIQLFKGGGAPITDARDTIYVPDLPTKEIQLQLQPGYTSCSALMSLNIAAPSYREHIKQFGEHVAQLLHVKMPQKGEGHCPLVCIQYLARCAGDMDVTVEQVTKDLGYDGNENGYPYFTVITDVLNGYVQPHGFRADWHVGVGLDLIDHTLDRQGYVMVNINSQGGSPHWVVVVGKHKDRYLIHNSGRLMFDSDDRLMLCVSSQHPQPAKRINAGSYQSISGPSLELLMNSGLHGSFWGSVFQRACHLNTVAITVEPAKM